MNDTQIKAKAGKFFLFGNKMKLLGACLLLIVVGIFCGFVISGFIGAFDTSFCADPAWLRLFFWTAICVFTFPILGLVIWSRTGQTLKSLSIIIVVFMLVSILPAVFDYGYELHVRYWAEVQKQEISRRGVYTDQVFSKVAMAEKAIPELNIMEGDRCSLGYRDCYSTPYAIEFYCKGHYFLVSEKYWPLFRRMPEEDVPGFSPELYRDYPNNVCGSLALESEDTQNGEPVE